MTSSGVCPVASRHSVVTSARRCYLARPTCATFAKNQSRCTWSVCRPRSHDRLAGGGKGEKFLRGAMGYIRGGEVGWVEEHQLQVIIKSTTTLQSSNPTTLNSLHDFRVIRTKQPTTKMNNFDCHPRVLSLSSASTPSSSIPTTPFSQSRRQSHESAHDAHHFVNQEEKTQHKLNLSIKKMWEGVKRHAVEHHKSVNAAYMASYGCGTATAANTTGGKAL